MTGKTKWFNEKKGYGFITAEDGTDFFVHYKDIKSDYNFKSLYDGQEVTFDIEQTPKGGKAVNVKQVLAHHIVGCPND
jgi:CspA family cold shock protein